MTTIPWSVLAGVNERLMPQKGSRKLILSPKYRAARVAVHMLTKGPPKDGKLSVHMDLYPANNRSDIDRFIKVVLDGMQGKAYANDRAVSELTVKRHPVDKTNPRVEVKVR